MQDEPNLYASTAVQRLRIGNCHGSRSLRILCQAPAHQSGIGLLEVLIAVILLSIGFLATARMQVEGMRYSQGAYNLSQAKFMVLDMTERMRVNREALKGDAYKAKSTQAGTSDPGCITSGTACSPADIALADLHAWSQNLYATAGSTNFIPLLPSSTSIPANGSITYDATAGAYSVVVQWSETLKGTDTLQSLAVKVFP